MTPAISVIVPCFNSGETITETLTSVFEQTWRDFELIVVNSGSSDNTNLMLEAFDDPRLQIVNAPPGNVALNRNRGLAIACAPLVTFLDADDLWSQDKLEAQYQALNADPDASVCYSWTDCIDDNGRFLFAASHASWEGDVREKLLLSNFVASGSNFMARTDVVRAIQGFDDSLSNCQDFDICIRLAEECKFVAVERTQIFYRLREQSMSRDLRGLEKSKLKILKDFFSRHPSQEFEHIKSKSYSNFYLFLSLKALAVPHSQCKLSLQYLFQSIQWQPVAIWKLNSYTTLIRAAMGIVLGENLNTVLVRGLKNYKSNTRELLVTLRRAD